VRPASETDATPYWWVDKGDGFVITEYKAQGPKGDQGEQGETGLTGPQGPAGKDGVWYVPDVDETWHKWAYNAEGVAEDQGSTGVEWLPEGTITAVKNGNGDVTFSNVKGLNGATTFTIFNSKILRSLTFIPDYTSADGTPQIVVRGLKEWEGRKFKANSAGEFWQVKANGKIYKGITVLNYDLSPSNATLADFDVIAYLHQATLLRSAADDYLVLTEEATVENGVLSVPVLIGFNNYPVGSDNKNHSVALQVKIKDEGDAERFVVSSEYVKVNFDLLDARIALNSASEKTAGTLLPVDITYTTIAAAAYGADVALWNGKAANGQADNPALAVINLNDYIYGVFEGTAYTKKMLDYGFDKHTFVFELIDLPTEGTDQSNNYVTLDEETGELKVKPAGSLVNQAAVGRTPVVLVKAVVEGKVYAVGYIKVIITDKFDSTPVEFEFNLKDYEIGCNSEYKLTDLDMTEIDFDQVFNHARIQLGKDAFFAEYKQGNLTAAQVDNQSPATVGGQPNLPGSMPATVGVDNSKHVWFKWAINPATQSVNLYNYLEGNIRNDAPVGTYKVVTTLKSNGYRPDVVITWNFKVTLPTYKLTANTAILKNGKIVVNPTILEQDAKTSTAYEGKLNNAFMHEADSYVFTPLLPACEEALTPYFVFTGVGLPTGYSVSNDGTKIMKGTEVAAVIETDLGNPDIFFVRLNFDNLDYPGASWNNYKPLSNASKGLVGKTVEVRPRGYINGATYNWINLYDAFNVEFVAPLSLVLPQDAAVYDQSNQGLNVYTFNPYDPTTAIVDWNGAEVNITTAYGRSLINHYEVGTQPVPGTEVIIDWVYAGPYPSPGSVLRPGHFGWWYAPVTAPSVTYHSPFVFDVDNATCNIQADGTIGGAINRPLPAGLSFKTGVVEAAGYETVIVGADNISVPTTYTFEWENASTGAIQDEFKVAIPVTVTHKWGVLNSSLVISIKPGSGN
jgi:hypothetical protein